MARNIIQDAANTLPHMVMSERIGHADLAKLAALSDGVVVMDLLSQTARRVEPLALGIVTTLAAWLQKRLAVGGVQMADLIDARIELDFRTDAIPTDRSRILPFDWRATCRLSTRDGDSKIGAANGFFMWERPQ